MNDRFFQFSEQEERLWKEYQSHKKLIVAFNFDSTVFDPNKKGDTFDHIEALLRKCVEHEFILMLFTTRERKQLTSAVEYCKSKGYEPNYVNISPVSKTRKPFYNILLDDRSGLFEAYQTLNQIIIKIEEK